MFAFVRVLLCVSCRESRGETMNLKKEIREHFPSGLCFVYSFFLLAVAVEALILTQFVVCIGLAVAFIGCFSLGIVVLPERSGKESRGRVRL